MPGHAGFHVGLIDRDLGGIDRLRLRHAVLDAGAPVLRVHRLAFPERGNGQTEAFGPRGDDAVDMTADAPARDGEAELAAIGPVALAGVEVEARATQPGDGQILERMADGEDAQRSGR